MHPVSAHPQILAPAGNRDSFLAALAAGADAVYCGLKRFSARMEAKNFSVEELALLTDFAHAKGVEVFVTLNSLIRTDELDELQRTIDVLVHQVSPDALIVQDLGVATLAGKLGFRGDIHLSTLANVSFPDALKTVSSLPGVRRVVLPRELGIDEIRSMAEACPKGIGLEVFVHGALCYGVSGRCYWSSFLGGKSGLRGSCVQPCRRRYIQEKRGVKGSAGRIFSCLDLSLDVLTKVLLEIPQIQGWKIEGRKKGPHYVYQTVSAYRLFRDQPKDGTARKQALELLENALGRPTTHYRFLDHRPQHPLSVVQQTGSGKRIGKIVGTSKKRFILTFETLEPGDTVRVGYEDDRFHSLLRMERLWISGSRIPLSADASGLLNVDTPVFLTDRRQRQLESILQTMRGELLGRTLPSLSEGRQPSSEKLPGRQSEKTAFPRKCSHSKYRMKASEITVYRKLPERQPRHAETGYWLSADQMQTAPRHVWIWLPPVVWPKDAEQWRACTDSLLKHGCRRFVLNMPYQIEWFRDKHLFEKPQRGYRRNDNDPKESLAENTNSRRIPLRDGHLELWAGPFCNASNPLAISMLKRMGFSGVIVSPELGQTDYLVLPERSPLPLGIVLSGFWPLSISRIAPESMLEEEPILSPKGEVCFLKHVDQTVWVYPNWELHLEAHRKTLEEAGYRLFIHLKEPIPKGIVLKKRPGLWNWENGLR